MPLVVAALALLGAPAAFAQESSEDSWMQIKVAMAKTRAEARAELAQARNDGSIHAVTEGYLDPARSVFSRSEVRAELWLARANGVFASLNGEAYDFQAAQAYRPIVIAAHR
jgi:1,2-phenylacetyl-CoA epoxidase PaaB subunit